MHGLHGIVFCFCLNIKYLLEDPANTVLYLGRSKMFTLKGRVRWFSLSYLNLPFRIIFLSSYPTEKIKCHKSVNKPALRKALFLTQRNCFFSSLFLISSIIATKNQRSKKNRHVDIIPLIEKHDNYFVDLF